ncbi:MAG: YceI family protein [Chitinophagaceae bacterium]
MKKNLITLLCFLTLGISLHAQDKFFTKSGKIEFYSTAPLEDIEAKNKTAQVVLDTKNGSLQFSVLMKGFEFEKALMQEHFNSDYVESDLFPKADFKGTITNNKGINYSKKGSYNAAVKGKLTLHGITKDVATIAIITVDGDNLLTTATFNIKLSDYKISIPSVVKNKISNNVKIVVDCKLDSLK